VSALYGARWGCPDCGRVMNKPPFRVYDNNPDGFTPGRYHAHRCQTPMVRVTVAPEATP